MSWGVLFQTLLPLLASGNKRSAGRRDIDICVSASRATHLVDTLPFLERGIVFMHFLAESNSSRKILCPGVTLNATILSRISFVSAHFRDPIFLPSATLTRSKFSILFLGPSLERSYFRRSHVPRKTKFKEPSRTGQLNCDS